MAVYKTESILYKIEDEKSFSILIFTIHRKGIIVK